MVWRITNQSLMQSMAALLSAAQKLWKEKKNSNKPIAAVFVADVSGSMDGEPLNRLKESLLTGQKYLGRDNSIGLVSYSSDVSINLPIGKYDTNQQSMFVGAVNSLQAGGGTATFDGIVVAMKMLQDELALNPNVKPMIFVLSDGETNEGHSLKDIRGLIETSRFQCTPLAITLILRRFKAYQASMRQRVSMQIQTMLCIRSVICSTFKCKFNAIACARSTSLKTFRRGYNVIFDGSSKSGELKSAIEEQVKPDA